MAFDLKTLSPLYRLITDTSGQSNALHIALRIGMPKALIERAHELAYKTEWSDMTNAQQVNLIQETIKINQNEVDAVIESDNRTINKLDRNVKNQINESKYRPSWQSEYALGDSVWVTTMNKPGIVSQTCNSKGEVEVIVLGKRIKVSHKRLKPYIEQKELYPEQYDLNIVLESKINRKKDKLISKGKGKGIIIEK
jgi:dsDNA-specific endonuclease/ATPase MutS2